jgi:gluconolactonase
MTRTLLLCCCIGLFAACANKQRPVIGSIERLDPALDAIIHNTPPIEVIGDGFEWCEGPLWIEDQHMLLLSDVFRNTVYKWTDAKGVETYLNPSGYTGQTPRGEELGSNGLLLNKEGKLTICQHGDRRLAAMNGPLNQPAPAFTTVADKYQGKRFNSPNDAVLRSNGDIFFTDPPYGMEQREKDPAREIPFHGVYRVNTKGEVMLLADSITRPNGIAFTPDERSLVVANSDPEKPVWYVFDIGAGDSLHNGRILYNTAKEAKNEKGLPDGLKIDRQGNMFASGPGGIWIFSKEHKLLGKIKLPESASNCALADDDRTLYITADMYLLRIKMR